MTRFILAAALALGLAGCAGTFTADERAAMRDAAVGVAIEIIVEAKDAGIDPVQISESKLQIINVACSAADKFLPIVDAYIETRNADDPDFEPLDLRGYVAAACAIAEAVISVKPEAEPEAV